MAAVSFEELGKGRFRVSGELNFATASQALEESSRLFAAHKQLELDLAGVESTDSAGLALLVEWTAQARRGHRKLKFRNLPKQALALARISELDKLLPVA